jgi:hypothetical protein
MQGGSCGRISIRQFNLLLMCYPSTGPLKTFIYDGIAHSSAKNSKRRLASCTEQGVALGRRHVSRFSTNCGRGTSINFATAPPTSQPCQASLRGSHDLARRVVVVQRSSVTVFFPPIDITNDIHFCCPKTRVATDIRCISTLAKIQWPTRVLAWQAPLSDPPVILHEICSNFKVNRCPRGHEQNIIVISVEQAIRRDVPWSAIRERLHTAGGLDSPLYHHIHAITVVKNSLAMIFDTGMREKSISTSVAQLAMSDYPLLRLPESLTIEGPYPRSQSNQFEVLRALPVLQPCLHIQPVLLASGPSPRHRLS